MTSRVNGFTVILDGPIREDDVEVIANAIRMIRHVKVVKPVIASGINDYVVEQRVRREVAEQLMGLAKEVIK